MNNNAVFCLISDQACTFYCENPRRARYKLRISTSYTYESDELFFEIRTDGYRLELRFCKVRPGEKFPNFHELEPVETGSRCYWFSNVFEKFLMEQMKPYENREYMYFWGGWHFRLED